jgi:hypothetical protein
MLENIRFCLLMTISKILAAVVTGSIIIGIPLLGFTFYLMYSVNPSNTSYVVEIMVIIAMYIILVPLCSKLALCCFRKTLSIADTKCITQNKAK